MKIGMGIRSFLLILILTVSFDVLASVQIENPSHHKTLGECANPQIARIYEAIKSSAAYFKSSVESKRIQQDEVQNIRDKAMLVALGSTVLGVLSIATLFGLAIWLLISKYQQRVFKNVESREQISFQIQSQKPLILATAVIAAHIYGFMFLLLAIQSPKPIESVTDELKTELKIQTNFDDKLTSYQGIRGFINKVNFETARVPLVYHKKTPLLPSQGHWWSFGWDEVALVDFEIEAVNALLLRSELGSEGVNTALPSVRRACLKNPTI